MTATSSTPVRIRSTDLDEAKTLLSQLFSPHELRLVRASDAVDVSATAWCGGEVTIARVAHGAEVQVRPGRLDTYYDVNIPLRGFTRTRSGRAEIDSNRARAAVLNPMYETDMRWSAECEQLAVKISRRYIERTLEAAIGRPLDRAVTFELGWDLTRGAGTSWVQSVTMLRQALEAGSPAMIVRPLEEIVVAQLLSGQAHTFSEVLAGGPARPHLRSVSRVIERIEADPAAPLTVGDMARIAGTSVRTLQASFAERVGVSPVQFLQNVRLARAHEELLASSPEDGATVSAIASQWGFSHLPRFAADYRRRYGQSPSQTLRDRR